MVNHRHRRYPLTVGIAIILLAVFAATVQHDPVRAGDGTALDILARDPGDALQAPPGDPGDGCSPPELIFPLGWGGYFSSTALDSPYRFIPLTWDCSDSTLYQAEVYEVERDTIDNVNKLRNPFITYTGFACSTNVDRYLVVYDNVYNWVSHYWRVRKACPDSTWSEWSDYAHYRIASTTPHAISPRGDQIYRSRAFNLTWTRMPIGYPYQVQLDDDPDFSSPIIDAPADDCGSDDCHYEIPAYTLGIGSYYWRVRTSTYADWSYARRFSIIEPPVTSCPILYSFDGNDFVVENPLLTACERSGYADVVADYYPVRGTVGAQNDRVLFELREMEDEITYLNDLALLTVDHSADTRVGCSVDGQVFLYRDVLAPLSAVDHTGTDRLAVLRDGDGETFTCEEPGYLELTFPAVEEETFIILMAPIKLPCPVIDPGPPLQKVAPDDEYALSSVSIEVLNALGGWTALPALPSREYPVEEAVPLLASASGEPVTVRVSWADRFSTDRICQYVATGVAPRVKTLTPSSYDVWRATPVEKLWAGFGTGETLVLRKGDVLQVGFDCGAAVPDGQARDYIVRAEGRYEPDYEVHPHLAPAACQLHEAYPNPFNPATTISYELSAASDVRLEVFNLLGQRVAELVNAHQQPGRYSVEWNTALSAGQRVASGVYLCRLTADGAQKTRKLVLLK